ncbi:MAG: hypothetical protein R3Y16_02400 [Rikenellaceae bacterium]
MGRIKRLKGGLQRLRHFRGHGVHSPFVYSLFRGVFMRREVIPTEDLSLLDEIAKINLSSRVEVELQNVYTHCGYKSFSIDPSEEGAESDFVVVSTSYPTLDIDPLLTKLRERGTTVAILISRKDRERERVCEEIVERHPSTTIRRPNYLLIFNNHLPKQHFQL